MSGQGEPNIEYLVHPDAEPRWTIDGHTMRAWGPWLKSDSRVEVVPARSRGGCRMTVALFCGSREWTDRDQIRLDIEWLPDGAVVVEGGARGADRIAREEALKRGLHVATVPALWERYGKSAGYRRNVAMLALATEVYAYTLGTPGTNHTIALAQQKRIPVNVRTPREEKVA